MREESDAADRVDALKLEQPDAYRLASVLSLAAQVEFALLRRARLLLPDVSAAAEADLCASDVVASRTPQGVVFDPDAAEILRRDLAGNPALLDQAWALVSAAHRQAPWPTRAEEHINRLSLSSDPADADRIQQILLAAAREMVESTDRVGAARWMMRALTRLTPSAGQSDAGRAIEAGAAVHLDGRVDLADAALPADAFDSWFPWLIGDRAQRVDLAVALFDGYLALGGSAAGGMIKIPDTTPLIVDVSWHDGLAARAERVALEPGTTRQVRLTTQEVELRGLDGRRYRLHPRGLGAKGRGGIDFGAVRARHRPFIGRRDELIELDYLLKLSTPGTSSDAIRVAITGDAGIGKTALLCGYLDVLEARGTRVLTHFFEGGPQAWQSFDTLETSLLAQILEWPSSSTGSPGPRSLSSELARHAPSGRNGPIIILLDGFEPNAFTGFRHDFLKRLPPGVRALWTQHAAAMDEPPPALFDLDAREQSNEAVCRDYLGLHSATLARTSVSPVTSARNRVFMSFSKTDEPLARQAGSILHESGLNVWLGISELRGGASWESELDKVLAEVGVFVLIASHASAESERIAREIQKALDARIPVVPITFDHTMPDDHRAFRALRNMVFTDVDARKDDLNVTLTAAVERARGSRPTAELILLERAHGNMGRLTAMIEWIGAQPEPVDLERLPPVLYGAFDRVWTDLTRPEERPAEEICGLLAAAREPLPITHLGAIRNPSVEATLAKLESAGLVTSAGEHGPWALSHERVREAIVGALGDVAMRRSHGRLLAAADPGSDYWLRHSLSHLIDAGQLDTARTQACDIRFLTRVCTELGVDNLEAQLADAVIRSAKMPPEEKHVQS